MFTFQLKIPTYGPIYMKHPQIYTSRQLNEISTTQMISNHDFCWRKKDCDNERLTLTCRLCLHDILTLTDTKPAGTLPRHDFHHPHFSLHHLFFNFYLHTLSWKQLTTKTASYQAKFSSYNVLPTDYSPQTSNENSEMLMYRQIGNHA